MAILKYITTVIIYLVIVLIVIAVAVLPGWCLFVFYCDPTDYWQKFSAIFGTLILAGGICKAFLKVAEFLLEGKEWASDVRDFITRTMKNDE